MKKKTMINTLLVYTTTVYTVTPTTSTDGCALCKMIPRLGLPISRLLLPTLAKYDILYYLDSTPRPSVFLSAPGMQQAVCSVEK